MRILVTGRDGMVGWESANVLAHRGEVTALGRAELDVGDPVAVVDVVRSVRPAIIVNCAAYTAVDRAETDRETAYLVNAVGPGVLAEEARAAGALLVHFSTDYVFDGTKAGAYVESDPTQPLSVYGESKLAGEHAIAATGCRHVILRTSWVYASRGRNFLLTMQRLGRERSTLRVVDDQHGAPTWARDLARVVSSIVAAREQPAGIFHSTASGETTWCGFAREIMRLSGLGTTVEPIGTADYPTPAKRPANSRLDCSRLAREYGAALPAWDESLAACLQSARG